MITCLGLTFPDDDARREHFRNELRKQLPELKKLEGFPIGEDEDIIALSDPPYYTACPNPWLDDFIAEWEAAKVGILGRTPDFDVQIPYAADVSEGKFDPIYLYHPYPTKVPFKAIMRYYLHYTEPGDVILDGFAGTGMAGVAAFACESPRIETKLKMEQDFQKSNLHPPVWGKRHVVLGDLSPLASFISYCYNSHFDIDTFESLAKTLFTEVETLCSWMYKTTHKKGVIGTINYVVWSDVFICPPCGGEIVFWNTAVDKAGGTIIDSFRCPNCDALHTKLTVEQALTTVYDKALGKTIRQAKTVPVHINYTCGGKRYEKTPDSEDLALIERIEGSEVTNWFPTETLPKGDKTGEPLRKGITNVHHFYTKRNLLVLSLMKELCPLPIFQILITKVAFQSTKLYRLTYQNGVWGAGGGPLSGTMYVPSLIKELNILRQIDSAIKDRRKNIEPIKNGQSIVSVSSCTNLPVLKDSQIDYIFTDPPFGHNLMYSELNFLSEAWLKIKTNNKNEAIENKSQNKSLQDYNDLITKSFKEYFRVLKPGKWMTVVFSNTSASVWNGIQTSLQRAGFVLANVAALDKQKLGFKAVVGSTAVKQDLVISCYKPSEQFEADFSKHQGDVAVWDFVREHLHHLPIHVAREGHTAGVVERDPRILYDRLITFYLMRGLPVPMDSSDFRAGLRQRFTEMDEQYFLPEQAQEYEQKKSLTSGVVQASLFIGTENEGIAWLREVLKKPQTRADLHPLWMQAITAIRKGDVLPDLSDLLNENFIQLPSGAWRVPDLNETKDREALRTKSLLKEFARYVAELQAGKTKRLKEVRAEALHAGFRDCWERKDFATVVLVGDRIPANLLLEDEKLLMYYDIAKDRV